MKKCGLAFVLFSLLWLSGCASVQLSSPAEDAGAKAFSPAPGRASLYIYRNEMIGAAVPMEVRVNGKTLGSTAAKTFFVVDVPPGKHSIVSRAENEAHLAVEAEPNKNYFIWQEVKLGLLYARTMLLLVDEAKGRAGVLESSLIRSATH
jgi:hypothetical protein